MCGIIAIVNKTKSNVLEQTINSLALLEYRGYDSAGIIVSNGDETFSTYRAVGKVQNLRDQLSKVKIDGHIALGHSRWATHGAPSLQNTHPIVVDDVAIIHNGIVENYLEIKEDLLRKGVIFNSDTDTEVIAALIADFIQNGYNFREAVYRSVNMLEGMFAIVVLHKGMNIIAAAKKGLPLIAAVGHDAIYYTSDPLAVAEYTNQIIYLEDHSIIFADDSSGILAITDFQRNTLNPNIETIPQRKAITTGGFQHFMLKEIYEQPTILNNILSLYQDNQSSLFQAINSINLKKFKSLKIIGCGSSFYAAQIMQHILPEFIETEVYIELASEFHLDSKPLSKDYLYIFISQSGETADIIASLKRCREYAVDTLGVVNIETSHVARSVKHLLPTYSGAEISVASTKAFTSQVFVLLLLAIHQKNESTKTALIHALQQDLNLINSQITTIEQKVQQIAQDIHPAQYMLYTAKQSLYPLATEGALKMKELSYIPTEEVTTGELKHGPIALIQQDIPVILLAEHNKHYSKLISNIREINARKGQIILIADKKCTQPALEYCHAAIEIPERHSAYSSFLSYAIPLQMLAYHVALLKGNDIDRPRNLAKSVTVE